MKIGADREMKRIDGNKTVYELVKEHPDLKPVLVNLGFTPLNNDKMLNTVGRMMSLNNGAKQINLKSQTLNEGLKKEGFVLDGLEE